MTRRIRSWNTLDRWKLRVCRGQLLLLVRSLIGGPLISITLIECGGSHYKDRGIANGFLGFDIGNHQAKIYGSGDERWTGTVLWTIGVAIARLLQEPDDFRNRFVYIYSAAFSQNEILAALEKGTDRIWDVQHLTLEDEIVAGRKKLESGDRSGVLPFVLSTFYRTGMGADYTTDVEAANVALRLSDESVMSVVQKALRFSLGT